MADDSTVTNSDLLRSIFGLPTSSDLSRRDRVADGLDSLYPSMSTLDSLRSTFGFGGGTPTDPTAPPRGAGYVPDLSDLNEPPSYSKRDILGELGNYFSQGTGVGAPNYNLDMSSLASQPDLSGLGTPASIPADNTGAPLATGTNTGAVMPYGSGSAPPVPGAAPQGGNIIDWLNSLSSGGGGGSTGMPAAGPYGSGSGPAVDATGAPIPPQLGSAAGPTQAPFTPYGSGSSGDGSGRPAATVPPNAIPPNATPAEVKAATDLANHPGFIERMANSMGIPLPLSSALGLTSGANAATAPTAPTPPAGPNLASPMTPSGPNAAPITPAAVAAARGMTVGNVTGQRTTVPLNDLAASIANAASGNGTPLVSPDIQRLLNANRNPLATPADLAQAATNNGTINPITGRPYAAAAPSGSATGNGPGGGGAGGGGAGGGGAGGGGAAPATGANPKPGSPGTNPGDAKVAATPPGVTPAPLPAAITQTLAAHGFKLPAQTWDALIAFGAGLMKNSDKPHFAQAAGAALEAATAQMSEQDKTKFTQDMENKKLLATIDQHRDELQARIDNQKLTHEERAAAQAEKATQDARHNELMTTLYGQRADDSQAGRDLRQSIATGQQDLERQRLQQQQQATQQAEADRQSRLKESANNAAQTSAKDLESQTQSDPALSQLPPNLKSAWVASQVAVRHPTSDMASSWGSTYKPQVVEFAKNEIARGTNPALVLQKVQTMGFPLTAADLR